MPNGDLHGRCVQEAASNDIGSEMSAQQHPWSNDHEGSTLPTGLSIAPVERPTRRVSAIAATKTICDVQIRILKLIPRASTDPDVHYGPTRAYMLRRAYNLLDTLVEMIQEDPKTLDYYVSEDADDFDTCVELVLQVIGARSITTLESAYLIAESADEQL